MIKGEPLRIKGNSSACNTIPVFFNKKKWGQGNFSEFLLSVVYPVESEKFFIPGRSIESHENEDFFLLFSRNVLK
jgi:hypothetical protein